MEKIELDQIPLKKELAIRGSKKCRTATKSRHIHKGESFEGGNRDQNRGMKEGGGGGKLPRRQQKTEPSPRDPEPKGGPHWGTTGGVGGKIHLTPGARKEIGGS